MHSVHDIVDTVNKALAPKLPPGKVYGIAQTVVRGDERFPAVISRTGEGLYCGIDDRDPVSLYHKLGTVTTVMAPGRGREFDIQNSYAMAMYVFLNRRLVNKFADELLLSIQAAMPRTVALDPYSSVFIRFNGVILNDFLVYGSEYLSGTFRLAPEHSLFQVNYTVDATFQKNCINNCD
jgi:hypothetical protein